MAKKNSESIVITPPNMKEVQIPIRGIAPLVVARFSKKAELMAKMQEDGKSGKTKKDREARDYEQEAQDAKHVSTEGWEGVSASAFRNSSIRACSLVGINMTDGKMSLFIKADGVDREEKSPLVRIYGDAETYTAHVRNATGVIDIRSRPMYQKWGAILNIVYDADQFKEEYVYNLIARAGLQVGICEGRPFSAKSAGLGYGLFEIVPETEVKQFRKDFGIKS